MVLNDFGKIATDEWFRSFEMRDELFLDEFILMPNHLHAIVGLETVGTTEMVGTGTVGKTENVGSQGLPVGTHGRASLQVSENETVPKNEIVP